MTKSEYPQPSQPLQPNYFWKWYVSLKKWQSLNIRNLRNLATYLSLKMIYIFWNDKVRTSAILATLTTYISLKMICIFKKMTKSEHPQPSQPIYLWKWYISLKMTKSEHPQPSQPLQPIYLWKSYISLKMTKSEKPQPSQPLQPVYFWKWYLSLKKWQSLNNRKPRNPRNLFIFFKMISIFENDKVWTSATLATLATYLSLKMIYIFENDKVWTSATLATLPI